MQPNPSRDLAFQGLKRLAISGSTDGPDYDQGVLSVIREIEQYGSFGVDASLWDSIGRPNPARSDRFSDGKRFAETALRRYRR